MLPIPTLPPLHDYLRRRATRMLPPFEPTARWFLFGFFRRRSKRCPFLACCAFRLWPKHSPSGWPRSAKPGRPFGGRRLEWGQKHSVSRGGFGGEGMVRGIVRGDGWGVIPSFPANHQQYCSCTLNSGLRSGFGSWRMWPSTVLHPGGACCADIRF